MFKNRVRLPIYTRTPQFPTESTRFRKANGVSVTLSVTIRKIYELITDYMGELMHQRLIVALNHDEVTIEGERYDGDVTVDGDYQIEWPDFIDYPLGQAKVNIQVTPFDMTNSNCQTCDVLSQLSLVDDQAGAIAEGGVATVGVYGNDTICCFPVTAEIVSFNTGYLASATIDQATGVVTLTALNPAPSVGNTILATYRVTCPDGSYDEADIYGSISGSEPECEQPSGFFPIEVTAVPPHEVTVQWTDPASPPSGGYEWELYETEFPGTPVLTGTTATNIVTFEAPFSSTNYGFYVRSVCGEGVYSPWSEVLFTTPSSGESDCNEFNVTANDGTLFNNLYTYSFMDCSGNIQNRKINNLNTRAECMLTDGGVPVFFQSSGTGTEVTYLFVEPC